MGIWVGIAVLSTDTHFWISLVGHIEWVHGVSVLPLDRIVKLHHGWESDRRWRKIIRV